ncbi:unnamed protein product [Lactuca saligna]|uniref:Uncharacterized protein n=1 Tax=Lactuca saligna TaxID=75948 RepID=A0AA36DYZ2_LACSI|nr:unnamed protein product [Lactuca saligna]
MSLNMSSLKEFHHRSSPATRHLIVTVGCYSDPPIADSGGDPDIIDWITIFEKVLGTRRRHDVDVNVFLQNPTFVTTIRDIIRSFKNQVNEENNIGEDEDT